MSYTGVKLNGTIYPATNRNKLSKEERNVLEAYAKAAGVDIVMYESPKNSAGEYVGVNGFYYDGVVYLDVNAGRDRTHSQNAVLLTAAHELTHFIRENAPAEYENLQTFVVTNLLNTVDFDALVQSKIRLDSSLSYEDAVEEVVADACEMVLKDSTLIERLAKTNQSLYEKIRDWLRQFAEDVRKAFEGQEARHAEAMAMAKHMDELVELWDKGLEMAGSGNKSRKQNSGTKFSYSGRRADGIEVYETSPEVKSLSWKERKKRFVNLMENQYRGRTAKFTNNGEVLYARFAKEDINKNIYGDKKSDKPGHDAKINTGADGDIFDLVENARYDHSEDERGKTTKAHRGIQSWDYFVKKVQIDGKVFDLIANVRKSSNAEYVYSIQLNEDKSTEAAPPNGLTKGQSLTRAQTASNGSIRNSEQNVKYSLRDNTADVKTAESYFGTTYKINEAGYLLTDGKLLDFSGRHEGGPGGYRTVDHRDVVDAFDGEYGDGSYTGGMIAFMQA